MSKEPSPGPWHVGTLPPAGWHYICDANGNTIAAVAEWEIDGTLIQEFAGARARTNADVLAAAWEMLETLRKIEIACDDHGAVWLARAAIAKATGTAP